MGYMKAAAILPAELLKEIQKYIQGETIYIPKEKDRYLEWGTGTGGKEWITSRNQAIKLAHQQGESIDSLARRFYLSEGTIKKIVYRRK